MLLVDVGGVLDRYLGWVMFELVRNGKLGIVVRTRSRFELWSIRGSSGKMTSQQAAGVVGVSDGMRIRGL